MWGHLRGAREEFFSDFLQLNALSIYDKFVKSNYLTYDHLDCSPEFNIDLKYVGTCVPKQNLKRNIARLD